MTPKEALPKALTLQFKSDPGHGWLAVKRDIVKRLGLTPTSCSYQRGKTVYLEEDCDASAFRAACQREGIALTLVDSHTDRRSPIRSYDSYGPDVDDPLLGGNSQ